jgi:hypothetical protein
MLKIHITQPITSQKNKAKRDVAEILEPTHRQMILIPTGGRFSENIVIFFASVVFVLGVLCLVLLAYIKLDQGEFFKIMHFLNFLHIDGISKESILKFKNADNPASRFEFLLLFSALILSILSILMIKLPSFSVLSKIKIYLLSPQEPFPLISRSNKKIWSLGAQQDWWKIVAKTTEPNAKARLDALPNLEMNADEEYRLVLKAKQLKKPTWCSEALANWLHGVKIAHNRKKLKKYLFYGQDIWPMSRLIIGKILNINDDITDKKSLGISKYAWFAFTTHRIYIAGWFVCIAIIMLVSANTQFISAQNTSLALLVLPISWAFWAISGHRKLMSHWYGWSEEWSPRPFGDLPLFVAGSSSRDGWEEIETTSIQVEIKQFGAESADMFNIAISIFFITSISILQLIK